MRRTANMALVAIATLLSACTAAQLQAAAKDGQLFCGIETKTGGLVVGLISAATALAAPAAAPAVIKATGATKTFVDAACAAAGGIAVSPPADTAAVPQVAVVPPAAGV